jgi:hypothetical protein
LAASHDDDAPPRQARFFFCYLGRRSGVLFWLFFILAHEPTFYAFPRFPGNAGLCILSVSTNMMTPAEENNVGEIQSGRN